MIVHSVLGLAPSPRFPPPRIVRTTHAIALGAFSNLTVTGSERCQNLDFEIEAFCCRYILTPCTQAEKISTDIGIFPPLALPRIYE